MTRSRIKYFQSRALALPDDLPSVLIRLMFAVNGISLAADSNDFWAETTEQHRAYRKPRARMYFIQLQSHGRVTQTKSPPAKPERFSS
jgi:hypothetical protein